jgi:methyltransferase (TIGR00027 family)
MLDNQPSATAQRVATHRAAHQLLDEPVIFEDPLALSMLGRERAEALRADPRLAETSRLSPFLRAFTAARSRLAEDELRLAVERGVGQYVILGAGLDTFALRNPYPAGSLKVFEVDFPATQAWKRARLAEAGLAPPEDLTFAPVDFETETLAQGLAKAGFDHEAPAFFSWLGVTPYLTYEAITAALSFVAALPQGSGVVFDYAVERALLDKIGRRALDGLTQRVGAAGEPWQAFFDPADLQKELLALGFSQAQDLGRDAINQRYFKDRKDGLRVGSVCRLMCAQV